MHYKDGTPAKVGDIVKGPSNDEKGNPIEIVGVVIHTYAESETCNLTVAHRLNDTQQFNVPLWAPEKQIYLTSYGRVATCTAGEFEKLG